MCEQQRRCAQSDQRLCCSLPRQGNVSSFCDQNFKPHVSFCSWLGQFESDLVGNSRKHVFSWQGSLTSGLNGGSHIPACNRLKLIFLKNRCSLTPLPPSSPHPSRFFGSFCNNWKRATVSFYFQLQKYCDFHLTENSDIIVFCKLYSTSCQPLMCHRDKILYLCPINSSHWVKISVQAYKFQWLAHQSLTTGTVHFT